MKRAARHGRIRWWSSVEQWSLTEDPEVVEMSGEVGTKASAVTQRAFRVVGRKGCFHVG
jgi:hypothetical protein